MCVGHVCDLILLLNFGIHVQPISTYVPMYHFIEYNPSMCTQYQCTFIEYNHPYVPCTNVLFIQYNHPYVPCTNVPLLNTTHPYVLCP